MTAMMVIVLLLFFGGALWLIPNLLSRSARRMPRQVPQAWVDACRAEDE